MPWSVGDETYKLSANFILFRVSLTPKPNDKVHLIVNQTETILFALDFLVFILVLSGLFLPSVCYLKDISCCKVIIFSQTRLN